MFKKRILVLFIGFFSFFAFCQEDNNSNETDFLLNSNFAFLGGYTLNEFYSGPAFRLEIDLIEGWIGKCGISSFLNGEFSFNPENTNTFCFEISCPGIMANYKITDSFSCALGLSFSHSWYIFRELINQEIYTTKLRTYGISFPAKLRYAFSKNFSCILDYNIKLHPSIPSSSKKTDWICANTFALGLVFSIPTKI